MSFDALSNVMKHLPKPATPSPGESPLPKGLMKLKTSTQANFDKMNSQLSKQIEDLKGKGVDVSGLVTLLSTAQNMLSQADTTQVEPPAEIEEVTDGDVRFGPYGARLEASRTALSDPRALARLAHDVHIEQTYLHLLNGQVPGSEGTPLKASPDNCPVLSITVSQEGTQPLRFREKNARGDEVLNEAGQRLLATYLYTDAKRQQEVHLLTLQTDQLMKLLYLQQETELLDGMLEQQDALVRGLSDWSSYLDQQTHEYVEMYEKMDALLSTQRRQSSFTVRDIQSLEQWTYWSQVVFWILLASCGVMAVVHNYRAVSKTAEAIDAGIGRVRTAVGA